MTGVYEEEIDWDSVWRDRRERLRRSGVGKCADLWRGREEAEKYAEGASTIWKERTDHIVEDCNLDRGMRILDIGAGTGYLLERLAGIYSSATAVEPARGMREVMEERFRRTGIDGVRVVAESWEDVDIVDLNPPYDRVVCAFALGMSSLREAVRKMDRVCRGRVNLYWFAGETSWQARKRRIWPVVHDTEIPPPGTTDLVYNVLYQAGLPVEVRRFSYRFFDEYRSREELIAQNRTSYRLHSPESERRFLDCIEDELEEVDGNFRLPGHAEVAAYSWKSGDYNA